MMINQYVEKLKTLLNQYEISNQEKQDIIDDYIQMIEDGKYKGLSDKEIINMVGTPEKIVKELRYEYKKNGSEKLIALSPFVSFIIFMILGFTRNLWHPGWLIFILIPITAIIVSMLNEKHLFTALSPFISFSVFILVGLIYDIWHPTWLIFLIIPMLGIINSRDEMDKLTLFTALSPFISLITFILIGYHFGHYHLVWLVFLIVPLLGIGYENNIKHKALLYISLSISTALYLYITLFFDNWTIGLLAFILFVLTGLYTGTIQIDFIGTSKVDRLIIIIPIILFTCIGSIFDLWAISWLLLLIIPVSMIIKYGDKNHLLTPLSPFIAVTIFVLLGYLYSLWHPAWIVLLLIPIVAIIENA